MRSENDNAEEVGQCSPKRNGRITMKLKVLLTCIALALFSVAVLAETKSDYDRSYDFSKLKTWDFKVITRMPRDPVGENPLWNQRIRDGLEEHFAERGYRKVSDGEPDFLVTYFMGIKEKYDIRYIDYGFPGRWGRWGPWGRWYGWGVQRGPVDVWRIPYSESTLVVDIIDAHTNQMVWRGYDTETVDFDKSEKTIHKSIENLTKRFTKDVAKQRKMVR
jgi:hypothetical protein